MWRNPVDSTNALLGWLFILTAVYFFLPTILKKKNSKIQGASKTQQILFIVILAAAVRLVPIFLLPVGAGYDIQSFRLVGEAFLNGEDVYTSAAAGRHPYLPLQMYWIALAFKLHLETTIPFVVYIKLLPAVIDVLTCVLLYQISFSLQKNLSIGVLWALLFAFNPVSVLVTAYHGQFDAIPVFLVLLAWYWTELRQKTNLSALALGFAILNKTWPIVFLPITLIRRLNWQYWFIYITIAFGVPVLFTLAYVRVLVSDPTPMLGRVLTHTGPVGYWGWSAILYVLKNWWTGLEPIYDFLIDQRRWLILAAGLAILWWTRKETAVAALTTTILAVFTVTAGMGMQWLLWLVPFAILDEDYKWLGLYSITGMFYLLVHLYGLHMYPWLYELFSPETAELILRTGPIPAWLTTAAWTIARLTKTRAEKMAVPSKIQD